MIVHIVAYSREIFQKIKEKIRFHQAEKEADSHYTILGNTLVRISNHCTWMKVWDDMLNKNPKWKGKSIVSIVFEDNGNTFSEDCLFSLGYRRKPIRIKEYVFESASLSKQDINLIIKSIQNIAKTTNFIDYTNKSKSFNRISVCPDYSNIELSSDGLPRKGSLHGADFVPENKEYKTNIMTKNKIRLTESQLHGLIKESVKKVLNEYEIGDTIPQELGNVYDAIDSARQALSNLQWKTMNYENYAWLYPRIEKIDSLLRNAVRLADPNLKD